MITSSAFAPIQPASGFIAGSKKDKKKKWTGMLWSLIRRPVPGTISELSPYFKADLSHRLTGKPSVTVGADPKVYNGVGDYVIGPEIL